MKRTTCNRAPERDRTLRGRKFAEDLHWKLGMWGSARGAAGILTVLQKACCILRPKSRSTARLKFKPNRRILCPPHAKGFDECLINCGSVDLQHASSSAVRDRSNGLASRPSDPMRLESCRSLYGWRWRCIRYMQHSRSHGYKTKWL